MEEIATFTPKGEEEIKQEIVSELGLDEEADKEKLEKMVAREMEHQTKLSTAIRQKQTHREKAMTHEARLRELGFDPETGKKAEEKKSESNTGANPKLEQEVDELRMDAAGDFTDEVKAQVRQYAKMNNVSYKEAAKSEYIKFMVQNEQQTARNRDASLDSKGGGGTKVSISDAKPSDVRKMSDDDFDKWKKKNLK
jgi:hypothetical protein